MNPVTVIKKAQALAIAGLTLYLVGCQQWGGDKEPFEPSTFPPWNLGEIQHSFQVSSVADSGPGTLREAIGLANASPGTDKIVFEHDDLYQQPQTINLHSSLPVITDNLLLDGFIDKMLWKASGVTLFGNNQHRVFEVDINVKAIIANLTVANGKASYGGGVLNKGETVVRSVTLRNNSATIDGGAIHNSGMLYMINSTLANNTAKGSGAGLFNRAGRAIITNTTFAWNTAKRGGALYNQSQIQMKNSILAASKGTPDCVSTVTFDRPSNKNIVESQKGCGIAFSRDNPMLRPLNYYNGPTMTIPITGHSPAINWGSNDAAVDPQGIPLKWDQRGNGDPRFAAGITDIGAFESQPRMVMEVDTLEDADKRWCTRARNDCSLRGALLLATHSKRFSMISFDPAIFTAPVTLTISEPLPKMIGPVTIDASSVPTVTVYVADEADQMPAIREKLKLKNIRISRQR